MTPAKLPRDEPQRIAALIECGVLDTEAEQDFDDLTTLAADLLGVPIALVCLIDTNRQWFKSRVGMDASESGRDVAFCSHAILGDDVMVVPDASRDDRFRDNPFVTEPPYIRFYAGAPLWSSEGHAFGTLCVIDSQPRAWSEQDAVILGGLARQAAAQLELRRKNRQLEAEIDTRREAEWQLEDARRKADDANRTKSGFLANMSHEIRTPLVSIIGFTEQLATHHDIDAHQRRDWIETIRAAADHLLALVNDVLDVSKIETQQMSFECTPTDVAELVRQTTNMLRAKAEAKTLRLDVELDPRLPDAIRSDPTRLRQVLVNLIGNAIKFTERGGVIVRLRYEGEASPPRLRLIVADTGPGLERAAIDRLFRAFSQADDGVTRRHGGTGLGLYISREICRGLGGELTVESEPGKGSTFACVLPAEAAAGVGGAESGAERDAKSIAERDAERDAESAVERGGEANTRTDAAAPGDGGMTPRRRVLIADDCDANRKLFDLILRRGGYEVVFAENGQEAIDACGRSASDGGHHLVLMDLQMPGVDGLEATRRLRAAGFDRPIVALTADATVETRQKAREAGCDDYLCKPLRSQTLLDTVANMLDHEIHHPSSNAA